MCERMASFLPCQTFQKYMLHMQVDLGPPTDMYMRQLEAFISASRGNADADIRSTFSSAAKTFEITQLIQVAATRHRAPARYGKASDGQKEHADEE